MSLYPCKREVRFYCFTVIAISTLRDCDNLEIGLLLSALFLFHLHALKNFHNLFQRYMDNEGWIFKEDSIFCIRELASIKDFEEALNKSSSYNACIYNHFVDDSQN